jgi:hypothetical protein
MSRSQLAHAARFAAWFILGFAANSALAQPPFANTPANDVEVVRELARHRGGQPAALAQVIQLTREFDEAATAEIIEELAAAHQRAGQLDLAATTRQALIEQHPTQPAARDALLWLLRLYTSSEVSYTRRAPSPGVENIRQQLSPAMAAALKPVPPTDTAKGDTLQPAKDSFSVYAFHLAAQAINQNHAWGDDPAIAFGRAVAARKAGQDKAAAAYLSPLKRRGDAWGQCARAEAWLTDGHREEQQPPQPPIHCRATDAPHLDGVLDDASWEPELVPSSTKSPTVLTANAEQPATAQSTNGDAIQQPEVRLAYDEEYLYIALRCRKAPNVAYVADPRPRPHDGDVESHDRVRLALDLDRDYATAYELVIDSRGWTADRCWNDPAWNPQWFVASAETPDGAYWTAEAAIPWTQLSDRPPHAGAAWTCAIQRNLPGSGQSSAIGPESFALLLFD